MPIRSNDHAQAIEDQGFKLLYNPPGGGNCLAELLHLYIHTTFIYVSNLK